VIVLKTVLLKFSGPLQSWGTDSHFETRHTDTHPSKSGVLGMIAAGLGYCRDDDENLSKLNALQFAVRVDQAGQILRDYHTAKKYKKNGELERTYVTNRYYLQDAVFLVALSSEDESLVNDVKTAVTYPYYPIFLGRRALPPTAELLQGIYNTDAITLLKEYPWQASVRYQQRHSSRIQIYADSALLDSNSIRLRNDIACSFSQIQGRKFRLRKEARITVDAVIPDKKDEHDIFNALGED
jgi:CRISPR system Cascade subunit CasD